MSDLVPFRSPYDPYLRFVVPHPRYGSEPRLTDVEYEDPPSFGHWSTRHYNWFFDEQARGSNPPPPCSRWWSQRIRWTAIEADLNLQWSKTDVVHVYLSHYFDELYQCSDCGRPFLFFAEEQRFMYEELRIPVDVVFYSCTDCRHHHNRIKGAEKRYQELTALADPTLEQLVETADLVCLLVEFETFTGKSLEVASRALNQASRMGPSDQIEALRARVAQLRQAQATGIFRE